MITQHQLDAYLGKSIAEICPNGYTKSTDDHSAHFIAHVLGLTAGVTCQMMGNGPGPAATLKVQEIFTKCPSVGVWSLRPAPLRMGLVFITRASNVNLSGKAMAVALRKHVGIFIDGFIWHYSNRLGRVVKETPSQFARPYPAPDNSMFYGSLP